MKITLDDVVVKDLAPDSLLKDENTKYIMESIDYVIRKIWFENKDKYKLFSRLNSMNDQEIELMLWEMHVDYIDENLNKEREYADTAIYDYSTGEIIKGISEAARIYGTNHTKLKRRLSGECKNDTSLLFYKDYLKGLKPIDLYKDKNRGIKVINICTKEVFKSIYAASKKSGIDKTTLNRKLHSINNETSYMLLTKYEEGFTTNKYNGI